LFLIEGKKGGNSGMKISSIFSANANSMPLTFS
jgi:hypothetical protein